MLNGEQEKLLQLLEAWYLDNALFIIDKRPVLKLKGDFLKKFGEHFAASHSCFVNKMRENTSENTSSMVHLDPHKLSATAIYAVLEARPLLYNGKEAPLCNELLAVMLAFDIIKAFQLSDAGFTKEEITHRLPKIRDCLPIRGHVIENISVLSSFVNALFLLRYKNDTLSKSLAVLALLFCFIDDRSRELVQSLGNVVNDSDLTTKEDLAPYMH